nr:hypothetical protein [Paenibacillus xylanivorans]
MHHLYACHDEGKSGGRKKAVLHSKQRPACVLRSGLIAFAKHYEDGPARQGQSKQRQGNSSDL